MRRIPWYVKNPLLKQLVRNGSLPLRQARNELRWIRQELETPSKVRQAVRLRGQGFPLQYILGSQPFGALDVKCVPGVLIPRWETEEWVSELAKQFKTFEPGAPRFLDICTGTGCVLFGLCDLVPLATGIATDINPRAIALFEENRRELNMASQTSVVEHDLFTPLPEHLRNVDCVVANPPYITDLQEAAADVREFEPREALLEPAHLWEALVSRVLETRASIAVFEVGYAHQIELCRALFAKHGWTVQGKQDSRGNWRTAWAQKTAERW